MGRELRQIVEHIISADTSGLASSRVKKAAGDTVFKEGDKGHFMYLVEDGMIEIVQFNRSRNGETGGIVGEMALVEEDGRRSANAVVRRNALPITINQRRFRDLFQRNLDFALKMKFLTRRVREMNERL